MGQTEAPAQANTWQGIFPLNNQASDGFAGVAPVGCYPPNGYGLYDMIGNVWELTRDAYRPLHAGENLGPDQERMATRPVAAGSGSAATDANLAAPPGQRVIKGGSYLCAPNYCMRYRAGARQGQDDDLDTSHLGFRTVLRGP
jgi:formylglycine-generating enzyme required for sulfatase activity